MNPDPIVLSDPEKRFRGALNRGDPAEVRRLFQQHPELRSSIDKPLCTFDAPPIVGCGKSLAMVDLLLELGADPNRRSDWWAGGFHALHVAKGKAAERLIAGGAIPDACAAAHLDRPDLLREILAGDPSRVHERGGDGQTPLHFAESREVVELLLDAGADIDARDVDHRGTPAEWMLAGRRGQGRYALAELLIERGATADLFMAAALGLTDRAREILSSDPRAIDARTGDGAYGEQPPSSFHIYFWSIGPGVSPLEVAEQFEHPETLAAMRAATGH